MVRRGWLEIRHGDTADSSLVVNLADNTMTVRKAANSHADDRPAAEAKYSCGPNVSFVLNKQRKCGVARVSRVWDVTEPLAAVIDIFRVKTVFQCSERRFPLWQNCAPSS